MHLHVQLFDTAVYCLNVLFPLANVVLWRHSSHPLENFLWIVLESKHNMIQLVIGQSRQTDIRKTPFSVLWSQSCLSLCNVQSVQQPFSHRLFVAMCSFQSTWQIIFFREFGLHLHEYTIITEVLMSCEWIVPGNSHDLLMRFLDAFLKGTPQCVPTCTHTLQLVWLQFHCVDKDN